MLKKLLKYDLISMFKFISVFYVLGIVFAILTRIFFSIENSLMMNIIGQITSGATISMLISILINNLMRHWVKFKNTIYDDEAYLTHTLPINKHTIYLSKFFTSFIIMILSFVVALLILFIAYYSKENIELLKSYILPITDILNISTIGILSILMIILFLELFSMLMCGCLGIIIGHRYNNNKLLKSVLFGFISYMTTQIIVVLTIFIIGLFNSNIMKLFKSNVISDFSTLSTLALISIIIYSLLIFINLFISIKIFKKGVNID